MAKRIRAWATAIAGTGAMAFIGLSIIPPDPGAIPGELFLGIVLLFVVVVVAWALSASPR